MIHLFMSCLLTCCTIVSSFEHQWTDDDKEALKTARGRCKELFKESPCLTKFKKMEPETYRATCGKNNKAE